MLTEDLLRSGRDASRRQTGENASPDHGDSRALTDPRHGCRHGWICESNPRSRRIDSSIGNTLLAVKTSAAARTPVYFSMTGAAA
jgi:hypothetical protein